MMSDNKEELQRIIYLISSRINDGLTVQEETELENWLDKKPENRQVFVQLMDESYRDNILEQWKPEAAETSLHRIKGRMSEHKRFPLWPRIAAAASVLLALSIGGYFLSRQQTLPQTVQSQMRTDIAPGGNKAILTLSNGQQISLTDASSGILSKEGNQLIKKANDGTISYENNGLSAKDQQPAYNTIVTPRGGQWSVVLPDGTKVMLDAASSIKYPISFTGDERRVEITGQAYFEVVHNAAKPFRVVAKGQLIEDIGTAFNVNAYDDETVVRTTLIEGSVLVSGVVLKPGQQAILQANQIKVEKVDVEEAIAWKNGYFNLNNESIHDVMRKLARWYDIEVEYKGKLPDIVLGGEIPRNTKLSQTLKILEVANVHFIIEGKKITVVP